MNVKVIVLGFGVVGQLEYKVLNKFNPDFLDTNYFSQINGHTYDDFEIAKELANQTIYDLAIIAVPTPTIDGKCDVSEVWKAVDEVKAKVYLVKSTVAVGTCDEIAEKTGKRIVHSPEHSGATQHCNNFEYPFTILGGDKKDCQFVQQIYQEVFDARHTFKYVDRKTAELAKYMENAFLATKVSFCVSFWEICQKLGLSYEELRECFVLDPRINPAHTFVYDDKPYWDSHCFNKDLPAIANQFESKLLAGICDYNEAMKSIYKK